MEGDRVAGMGVASRNNATTWRCLAPPMSLGQPASFCSSCTKFRLERISRVAERFESCGDYTKGIACIQCSNPSCRFEHFRPSPARHSISARPACFPPAAAEPGKTAPPPAAGDPTEVQGVTVNERRKAWTPLLATIYDIDVLRGMIVVPAFRRAASSAIPPRSGPSSPAWPSTAGARPMRDEPGISMDRHPRRSRAVNRLIAVCLPGGKRLARPCPAALTSSMHNMESLFTTP